MPRWDLLTFDRSRNVSVRPVLTGTDFLCSAIDVRADGLGVVCDVAGAGADAGRTLRRFLPWWQIVWIIQDVTPLAEGAVGPVFPTEWRTLTLDPLRETRVRISSFPTEFRVTVVDYQPGGLVCDIPAGGADLGKTFRRYVPWSQVVYVEQDVTPGPPVRPPVRP